MASPERGISRRTFLVTVALGTAGVLVGLPAVVASGPKPEASSEILTFTDEVRRSLIDDGAVIYLPTGETIRDQKSARRPFWCVTYGYKVDGKNRSTEFSSRRIEVAIYPDPAKFFVPASFGKTMEQQEALVAQDTHSLRKRLGVEGITEILPEVSEATEVIFKHFDATNVRLLGQDYMHGKYWSFMRTSTPTNKENLGIAYVGRWDASHGLRVDDWGRYGSRVSIGAARWVVPQSIIVPSPHFMKTIE